MTTQPAYHSICERCFKKISLYPYLRYTYSSRRIENFTANNIRVVWMAGMQRPYHNSINTFRISKLEFCPHYPLMSKPPRKIDFETASFE